MKIEIAKSLGNTNELLKLMEEVRVVDKECDYITPIT
jgi:hypothetical protein